MAIVLDAKAVGFEKAKVALRGFPKAVRNRALRRAFTRIGQIVAKELRRRVRKNSKTLQKSIGLRVKIYRSSGNLTVVIGPRAGFDRRVIVSVRRVAIQPRNSRGQYQTNRVASTVLKQPTRYFASLNSGNRRGVKADHSLEQSLQATKPRFIPITREEVRKVVDKYGSN